MESFAHKNRKQKFSHTVIFAMIANFRYHSENLVIAKFSL